MTRAQPETKLVGKIRDAIRECWPSSYVVKVSGGPYQEGGIPDLLVCVLGRFIGLEVKCPRPGELPETARKRATDRQRAHLIRIREAGGIAAVVLSVEESITVIEKIVGEKCRED